MKYQIINHQHIFETELPLFRQCHASTLCTLPNGEFAAAWFGGDHEKAPNVAIWLSIRKNGEWGYPIKVADRENVPCWNPVLMCLEDRLVLFYKVGKEIPDWQTFMKESFDFGNTWGEEKEMIPGDFGGRGPVKNKCILLKDGTILAPASTEKGRFICFVDRSVDGGKTWERSESVPIDQKDIYNAGLIQPSLWEDSDGQVHMLIRSSEGAIFRSDSKDGGRSWSVARRTQLPNNNCGIDLTCLEDGRLVLVYNPVSGNWGPRSPIAFAVSEDNGDTWSEPQVLEHTPSDINQQKAEYSYPAVLSKGNDVYFTYTWKRRTIAFWQIRLPKRSVIDKEKAELFSMLVCPFDKAGRVNQKALQAEVRNYIVPACSGLMFAAAPDKRDSIAYSQIKNAVCMLVKEVHRIEEIENRKIPVAAIGSVKGKLEAQIQAIAETAETGIDITVLLVDDLLTEEIDDTELLKTLEKILCTYPEMNFGLCEGKKGLSAELAGWCAQTGRFVFFLDASANARTLKDKINAVNTGKDRCCNGRTMRYLVQDMSKFLCAMRMGADGFCGMHISCFPIVFDWMRNNWNDDREQADQIQNLLTMLSVNHVIMNPESVRYLLGKINLLSDEELEEIGLPESERIAAESTRQFVDILFEEKYLRQKSVLNY